MSSYTYNIDEQAQTIIALTLVLLALAWLIRRRLSRKTGQPGGGCGCDTGGCAKHWKPEKAHRE